MDVEDWDWFDEKERRKAEEKKEEKKRADSEARRAVREKFSCTTCLAFEHRDTLEFGDLAMHGVEGQAIGICRLRPPTPAIAGEQYATARHDMQPVVMQHTWCLQHQPIPEPGDDTRKP